MIYPGFFRDSTYFSYFQKNQRERGGSKHTTKKKMCLKLCFNIRNFVLIENDVKYVF